MANKKRDRKTIRFSKKDIEVKEATEKHCNKVNISFSKFVVDTLREKEPVKRIISNQ